MYIHANARTGAEVCTYIYIYANAKTYVHVDVDVETYVCIYMVNKMYLCKTVYANNVYADIYIYAYAYM